MRKGIVFAAIVTLGMFARTALADEPPVSNEISPMESAPPPATVAPPPGPEACPPLLAPTARVDHDLRPGHGLKVAGGLMFGLGLATLAAGAGVAGWATLHTFDLDNANPSNQRLAYMAGGSIVAILGGLSTIAGIPMMAVGASQSRRARQGYTSVAFAPVGGGGMAQLTMQR